MNPRIAIPLPHGGDPEYALRAIPQYEGAVQLSGGEAVRIPLDRSPAEIMKLIEHCHAVLLPGSKADVDPAKFGASPHPKTEAADPKRDTVDELLLQDAYNMRKPILGICYGLQILNVYQSGTLLQHIESTVNHEAGRKVPVAHAVVIEPGSRLAEIVGAAVVERRAPTPLCESVMASRRAEDSASAESILAAEGRLLIPVNSSHHQAAGDVVGDGLRIVARCPDDAVIEGLEGTSPGHFVLAVQWHPERSFNDDPRSRALFRSLVEAARSWSAHSGVSLRE
jgi:putative glutamine amidotransferase